MIDREEKAEIRRMRLEHGDAAEVVGTVPRDDAEPGIEQVVRFVEERAIVDR